MRVEKIISIGLLSLCALTGCKWRDDFRGRVEPQMLEPLPRPTLNVDSIDYTGNPIEKEIEIENEPIPDIDCLNPIPEVPEYPAGIYVD